MTEARLQLSDGGALAYRVDGPADAPWLVFSNSVMTDLTVWDAQAALLSANYRILRYDQRGHGQSSLPTGAMDFAAYGRDLIELLDGCSVQACTFIGLSMGVPTGLAALMQQPARFTAFVAVDGVAQSAPGREAFWTERRDTARSQGMEVIAGGTVPRWLPGVAAEDPRASRLQQMVADTPTEGFAAATHALQSYDLTPALPLMTCPFLGIAGQEDGTMPQAIRNQFGTLPQARFAEVPQAGHLPNFQCPDAFNAALTAFLSAPSSQKEIR